MKRFFLLALILPGTLLAGRADPGAPLVAADTAFGKDTEKRGTWTAIRAVALPQGEIFVPERANILEYGRDAPNPRYVTKSRTEHAWISCDGTVGVTLTRWTIPKFKEQGWAETVWAKDSRGRWGILLLNGSAAERKLYSRPGRKGMRAACSGTAPPLPIVAPDVGVDYKMGASHDQTLIWTSAVTREGDLRIVISLWNGKTFDPVLEDVAQASNAR